VRIAGHLNIGPLRMVLQVRGAGQVRVSNPAYAGFYSDAPDSAAPAPLCEMPVEIIRQVSVIPSHEPLWRADRHWAIWEEGADLICCVGIHQREHPRFHCRIARDGSLARLSLDPESAESDPTLYESPLCYPMDQILSWGMLSRIGGVLLHAAVAVRDGVGWVFAGHSGAGKSTLSALCHAEGFRILNDDRVMLFQRDGEWKVAGTPWHGSGRFAEAAEVPLGGLFFLQQATESRMVSVSASQARLALLDVAAVPWFEDAWSQGMLDGLEQVVQGVDARRFHFTKTSEAVAVLKDAQDSLAGVCA